MSQQSLRTLVHAQDCWCATVVLIVEKQPSVEGKLQISESFKCAIAVNSPSLRALLYCSLYCAFTADSTVGEELKGRAVVQQGWGRDL